MVLGNVSRIQFKFSGDSRQLDAAIDSYQRGLALASESGPELRVNLALALRDRYLLRGDTADLDEAVAQASTAARERGPGQLMRANVMTNLGFCLLARYQALRDDADLVAAVAVYEEAVADSRPSHNILGPRLTGLAGALRERFYRYGDMLDLDRAVAVAERAFDTTPPDATARPGVADNLALLALERYRRLRQPRDLHRAVQLERHAVEAMPPNHPDMASCLYNLGLMLYELAEATGGREPHDQARVAFERSLALPSASREQRTRQLHTVGALALHDEKDPDKVVRACKDAVVAAEGTPYMAVCLRNLGVAWRRLPNQSADVVAMGVDCFRRAIVLARDTSFDVVFTSGRDWGNWAFERGAWDEAHEAYGAVLATVEPLRTLQLARRAKEVMLEFTQSVATRFGWAAARMGRLRDAVLAIECARATLLSDVLARDAAELTRLGNDHADLALAYTSAATELWELEAAVHPGSLAPSIDQPSRIAVVRAKLADATAAIRARSGYEQFMAPPSFDEIEATAEPGLALVYLVTTPAGGLALVVTRAEVEAVWSDVNDDDVQCAVASSRGIVDRRARSAARTSRDVESYLASARTDNDLGTRLLEGVLPVLVKHQINQVALIACGALGILPLHASRVGGVWFHERFVVRFAPNARALAAASRRTERAVPRHWVGVGDPAPHAVPLPAARVEAEQVAALFSASERTVLVGGAATRSTVLAALPRATVIHFACHGVFRPHEPLKSELQLAGGDTIGLQDFLDGDARPTGARLIVLSACDTAVTDTQELPNEAIGFPSTLLQAGAAGVVGTLWPVDDLVAFVLVSEFYRRLLAPGAFAPAAALAAAQRWLRTATVEQLLGCFRDIEATHPTLALQGRRRFETMEPEFAPFASNVRDWGAFVYVGA
jgi:CHAT domain-containing protein